MTESMDTKEEVSGICQRHHVEYRWDLDASGTRLELLFLSASRILAILILEIPHKVGVLSRARVINFDMVTQADGIGPRFHNHIPCLCGLTSSICCKLYVLPLYI
jgi:hypothetical protein